MVLELKINKIMDTINKFATLASCVRYILILVDVAPVLYYC